MNRLVLFIWLISVCKIGLSQERDYRVEFLDPSDKPVYSAYIYFKDSLIAVHDASLDERIYLDVDYAEDSKNYQAGAILFREYGGRRENLLRIRSCQESTEDGSDENLILEGCIQEYYISNLEDLSPIKRKNLLIYITRNI